MFVARLLDIRVCTAAAHHSNQGKVLTEQAAVFGEGGGLFHAIPDTSCIVKPVKKKKKKRHLWGRNWIHPPHFLKRMFTVERQTRTVWVLVQHPVRYF